jgi:hypothetical protein
VVVVEQGWQQEEIEQEHHEQELQQHLEPINIQIEIKKLRLSSILRQSWFTFGKSLWILMAVGGATGVAGVSGRIRR